MLVPLVIAIVFGLFSGALALRERRSDHLHGDEVEYLLQARALRTDHDLIMNNEFLDPGDAYPVPPTFKLVAGEPFIASFMPGQPALLILPDLIGGATGAVLWAAALWTSAGVALFLYLHRVLGTWPALGATGVAGLSVPLAWHAASLFTEIPALVLLILALLLTQVAAPRRPHALGAALILAALPWLHQKYGFLAAGIAAALLLQAPWRRYTVILIGVVLGSAAGTIAFAEAVRGTPYYTPPPALADSRQYALHGLALFFDRNHGIVPIAPIWLVAGTGALVALRHPKLRPILATNAVAVFLFVAVYLAGLQYQHGEMPPGREMISLVPILTLCLGIVLHFLRGAVGKAVVAVAAGASMAAGTLTAFLATPDMFFNNAGRPKLLLTLSARGLSLPQLFPDLSGPQPRGTKALALDLGVLALLTVLLYFQTDTVRSGTPPAIRPPRLRRSALDRLRLPRSVRLFIRQRSGGSRRT